jgi:hypothetical protein
VPKIYEPSRAIDETALQRWGYVLLSQHAGLEGRDVQSALALRKNAADERDATYKRMEDHKRSCRSAIIMVDHLHLSELAQASQQLSRSLGLPDGDDLPFLISSSTRQKPGGGFIFSVCPRAANATACFQTPSSRNNNHDDS